MSNTQFGFRRQRETSMCFSPWWTKSTSTLKNKINYRCSSCILKPSLTQHYIGNIAAKSEILSQRQKGMILNSILGKSLDVNFTPTQISLKLTRECSCLLTWLSYGVKNGQQKFLEHKLNVPRIYICLFYLSVNNWKHAALNEWVSIAFRCIFW